MMEYMLILLAVLVQVLLSGDSVQSKKQPASGSQQVLSFSSIVEPPFMIQSRDQFGEIVYKGYIPDLVEKVARRLKVPYRIRTVKNGAYGVPTSDGSWNGMIGEIIKGEANVAGGALSVRPARQEVVDFTEPFMTVGIKAVFKRPGPGETLPVTTLTELANQTNIQYGVIDGSMTMWFFKASRDPTLNLMWQAMEQSQPPGLLRTAKDGIERVRNSNGSFAFMMESTFADYAVNNPPCDLVTLDQIDLLNPNSYAFAVRKGSPFKQKISRAIRALKRRKELDKLYNKWWKADCIYTEPETKTTTVQPTTIRVISAKRPQSRSGTSVKTRRLPSKSQSSTYWRNKNKKNSTSRNTCDLTFSAILLWIISCVNLNWL